jgi:hypothetical protein
MRGIVALGETLAAPDNTPPAEFFQGYVNATTQGQPGLLREYQRAAALLNATATRLVGQGAHFLDLSVQQREEVLRTLLWQYSGSDQLVRRVEVMAAARDAVALRMYVMGPMIAHYYRSPFGWAVVGYQSFPGTPQFDAWSYSRPLGDEPRAP